RRPGASVADIRRPSFLPARSCGTLPPGTRAGGTDRGVGRDAAHGAQRRARPAAVQPGADDVRGRLDGVRGRLRHLHGAAGRAVGRGVTGRPGVPAYLGLRPVRHELPRRTPVVGAGTEAATDGGTGRLRRVWLPEPPEV